MYDDCITHYESMQLKLQRLKPDWVGGTFASLFWLRKKQNQNMALLGPLVGVATNSKGRSVSVLVENWCKSALHGSLSRKKERKHLYSEKGMVLISA
jgi:hypothetical protein